MQKAHNGPRVVGRIHDATDEVVEGGKITEEQEKEEVVRALAELWGALNEAMDGTLDPNTLPRVYAEVRATRARTTGELCDSCKGLPGLCLPGGVRDRVAEPGDDAD